VGVIVVLLVLLLSPLIATAQPEADGATAAVDRWFTSHVEIVEYAVRPSAPPIRYDDTARVLFVGDRSYAYPEAIESIYSASGIADGQIVLDAREPLPDTATTTRRSRRWVWYLDPRTEAFTRFASPCDQQKDLHRSDLVFDWKLVQDTDTGLTRLCSRATGETSDPLPANLAWEIEPPISGLFVPVSASLDGRWLLLFGEESNQVHVFSYATASGRLLELGRVVCSLCIERNAVRWYGSLVTIWVWDWESDIHRIYAAEIDRAESLELAVTRPHYLPEFYDDPPRYDYVNFTTPEDLWETQCERVIYDIVSAETRIFDMGPVCRPEHGSLDGVGYYRDVTRGMDGVAALTRFDARTGEREILYEGEIELIEWVSPDERYAAVVLGNNGSIDVLPFLALDAAWQFPDIPKLAYIDLVSDTVLFESWTGWRRCDAPFGGPRWSWTGLVMENAVGLCDSIGPTGALLLRDDGSLLSIGTLEPQHFFPDIDGDSTLVAEIVRIKDGNIERTRIAEGRLIPFSANDVISVEWDPLERTMSYILVPVAGGRAIELTHDIPADDFQRIALTHVDPSLHQLRFSFWPEPNRDRDWSSANVTIRVALPD
jgi:hypothetical protein